MNFIQENNSTFSIGIDLYKRIYSAMIKSNGLIKISNILTGKILFDNINPNNVLINGNHLNKIEELQIVIYNKSCQCDSDNNTIEYRIFDKSFELKFE